MAAAVGGTSCSGPTSEPDNPAGVIIHRTADPSGFLGAVPPHPYAMPSATFVDTAGRTFRLPAAARKPATLIFFGYTNCPDVCATVLADLAQALRRVDSSVRAQVDVLFVTTDPGRDTPARIRRYLDRFDPAFVGLTGSLSVIEKTARALDVPLEGTHKLPGGGYEVGHGAQVIGFGTAPSGQPTGQVLWLPDTPIDDLRHDITQLVRGQADGGSR